MTPFDTALRVQRREVDTVKVSISVEIETIAALNHQAHAHDARMREERVLAASVPVASASSALAPRAGRALRQDLFGAGRQQRECLIVPPGQWPLGKRPPLTLRAQFDKYSIAVQCGCALRPCALQPGCAARPWRPLTRTSTSWCS